MLPQPRLGLFKGETRSRGYQMDHLKGEQGASEPSCHRPAGGRGLEANRGLILGGSRSRVPELKVPIPRTWGCPEIWTSESLVRQRTREVCACI